jgi:hypothetical protein
MVSIAAKRALRIANFSCVCAGHGSSNRLQAWPWDFRCPAATVPCLLRACWLRNTL